MWLNKYSGRRDSGNARVYADMKCFIKFTYEVIFDINAKNKGILRTLVQRETT